MHVHVCYLCEAKAESPRGCSEFRSLPMFSSSSNVQAALLLQPLPPPRAQPLTLKCEPHEDTSESKSLREA